MSQCQAKMQFIDKTALVRPLLDEVLNTRVIAAGLRT